MSPPKAKKRCPRVSREREKTSGDGKGEKDKLQKGFFLISFNPNPEKSDQDVSEAAQVPDHVRQLEPALLSRAVPVRSGHRRGGRRHAGQR